MLVGSDANTTAHIGREGTVVVDTQRAPLAAPLLAALRELSAGPIVFIINTTVDEDHVGGNEEIARAGASTFAGIRPDVVPGTGGAPIYAHERLLARLAGAGVSTAAWPTFTYFTPRRDLFVNDEAVQLFHARAAHTDADTIVLFRRTDVISAGDLITPDRYPVIDVAQGGSINGLLDAINVILELAVPEHNQEGGTLIVPGHGRLCDESDVSEYRDMLTIVRDRVQHMVDNGLTMAQVLANRPTMDYDPVYGGSASSIRTFVETVYRSLAARSGSRLP